MTLRSYRVTVIHVNCTHFMDQPLPLPWDIRCSYLIDAKSKHDAWRKIKPSIERDGEYAYVGTERTGR